MVFTEFKTYQNAYLISRRLLSHICHDWLNNQRLGIYLSRICIWKKGEASMTKNQIEYNKFLETVRSNRFSESLNRLIADRNYEIGTRTASESERHNRATESLDSRRAQETERHNLVSELSQQQSLKLDADKLKLNERAVAETERSNKARERETKRANKQHEAAVRLQLAETQRSNLARETETARSNRANEALGASRNAEIARSNRANESLQADRNAEVTRSNYAAEWLKERDQNLQMERHQDQIAYNYDDLNVRNANAITSNQQNYDRNQESKRHNKATESTSQSRNAIDAALGVGNLALKAKTGVAKKNINLKGK